LHSDKPLLWRAVSFYDRRICVHRYIPRQKYARLWYKLILLYDGPTIVILKYERSRCSLCVPMESAASIIIIYRSTFMCSAVTADRVPHFTRHESVFDMHQMPVAGLCCSRRAKGSSTCVDITSMESHTILYRHEQQNPCCYCLQQICIIYHCLYFYLFTY